MTKKLIKLVDTKGKSTKQIYRELKDGLDQHDDSKLNSPKKEFNADNLREDYKAQFGIDLPITGGPSESEERAIVILEKRDAYSIQIEYAILKFFAADRGCNYEIVERICYSKNGKQYEKFKIAWSDDDLNYYNFYFDITASMYSQNTIPGDSAKISKQKKQNMKTTELTFIPKITSQMKTFLKNKKQKS